jgi:tetratricopeptide (TPR) repeat protein
LGQEPIVPPSRKEDYIASFIAAAQAAIDSRRWDEALATLDRLIEIIPETPLAYYLRAQALAGRGEAQMLFQDLEVTSRALGAEVVSEPLGLAFDQNLAEAQRLLALEVDLEAMPELKPLEDECRQKLASCLARGKVLFQPSLRTALVLQSLLQAATPVAAEVAALVMAFRRCGEPAGAIRAAQVGWRPVFEGDDVCAHPLVLAQVALAEPVAANALAEAQDALEFQAKQGDGWPELPMLHYLLARTAFLAGAYPVAMQAIQNALAAWPDESRWQELAANIYLAQDPAAGLPDRAAALVHLEQAVALEPERAASLLALGQLYLEEGQAPRALQSLKQAGQLDPAQPKVWIALAQAHYALGELEQAAVSADRAIEANPQPEEALLLRGRIALQTNNPRGALSRAQAILRTEPNHAEAIYLLSNALEAMDRPAEALVALERALSLSKNPLSMQIERVQLIRRTKGPEAGVAALQELVAHNPQQPVLMALLAEWLNEAGRPEAAIQAARLALQEEQGELSEEQRAGLHILIGLRMRSAGQLDQAIHHLSEAVAHAPANLEAYLELGRAYQERREYRQALKVYQRAMSVANGDYRPYYQAGLVLKDNKDYVAAEAMLRRAAQLAPAEVSVHRLLGAVVALNLVHNRRLTPMEH